MLAAVCTRVSPPQQRLQLLMHNSRELDCTMKHLVVLFSVATLPADIPVTIDWDVLDQELMTHFWDNSKQPIAASNSNGSSDGTQQQQQLAEAAADRPWFFDRLLVFHRGVGITTAEGIYLDKKLDILLGYLFVDPVVNAFDNISKQVAAITAGSKDGDEQQQPQQQHQLFSSSADLSHPFVRRVTRRSLKSTMTTPQQVWDHLWQKLTLVVGQHGRFISLLLKSCYSLAQDLSYPLGFGMGSSPVHH